ncbi:hypothetical protein EAH89_27545 [Roseomonas nepalensis]|uniref:Polysaccharide biosynthesis protein n=1 Tax=Muricoccus nepalensis TaxID=1854500 RepID=A0A502F6B3_9PROT|nr:hypothetical protein [Roseomonas nepalensis]TPG44256.1 hypothetical protein EAH89_27545 [Roseomonas nepalensis]
MQLVAGSRAGGLLAGARRSLGSNLVLLGNTAAISLGTALTAVSGFAYWWVAARSFTPEAVGTASALVSVIGLIGLFGECGLGTLLLGAALGTRQGLGLIGAAMAASLAASALLGAGYVALGEHWPAINHGLEGFGANDLLLVAGCALTGLTLLTDQSLIAQLRGRLQLLRNVTSALTKLAALLLLALWMPGADGTRLLLLAWVGGMSLALATVGLAARRSGLAVVGRPDFGLLARQLPRVVDHHALNLAAQAPTIIFPFLIAVLFSPAVNAAFYPAWAMVHAASLFTAALTMVLYRIGTNEPQRLRERLGFSLALSCGFALAVGGGLFVLSGPILAFFNPDYPAIAGPGLALLGFGLVSLAIRQHYLALMRLRGRMRASSVHFAAWSVLEIACACAGGLDAGLRGFVLGWLLSLSLQAATMLRPLIAASDLPGRRGRGA